MLKAVVFDFGNVVGFFDHYKTLAKLSPYTSWPAKRIYEEIYSGTLEDDIESGRMTVEEFAEWAAHFKLEHEALEEQRRDARRKAGR